MPKMKKCSKIDCFAIDKYVGMCTLLRASARDAPGGCSFYCSDPDGEVKRQIQSDIKHYYNDKLGGNNHE